MPITALPNAFTFSNYWNGLKNIIDKINSLITSVNAIQQPVIVADSFNVEANGLTLDLGNTNTPVQTNFRMLDTATGKTVANVEVYHTATTAIPLPLFQGQAFNVIGGSTDVECTGGLLNGLGIVAQIYTDAATGARLLNMSYLNGVYTFDLDKSIAAAFSPVQIVAVAKY